MDDHGNPGTTFYDGDDKTEPAGSNRERNEAVESEINVKWQMPGHHDVTSAKKMLQELLADLMVYFPNDVALIDNKKREWSFSEKDDAEKFMKESNTFAVTIHPIKNQQQKVIRWVAITRIRSRSSIQEWKDNDFFYSAVNAARVYMFPHPFSAEAWDTITIGFLKNIHAIHYPRELLQEQLYEMIQNQTKSPPPFQLIPQRITTTDKKATTKAFTIHCQKEDASQLTHLFTHGPFRMESNQIFVPFKYKKKNPDLFSKCIRQQNEVYHKTWIIKVEGLTTDMMKLIQADITKIMGVLHVVPSRRLHEIGEWKILVDQTKCSYIHRQLTTEWEKILDNIPNPILENAPITFPIPSISSKRARDYQDNDSDNDSYGSLLSTGTATSEMTHEADAYNDMPTEFRHSSYAAAATSSSKSGEDTQVSSPTTSTYTEWQQEKKELEDQIKSQAAQIEKIQADLQSKITRSKDLEDQLAQAIELAHSRDARHEEMLLKFEQLMKMHTGLSTKHRPPDSQDDNEDSQPNTPERPPIDGPPSKKPNQNSSPHRNIYSIFRQQHARQHSSSSRKQHSSLLTQPMETDDENRQLSLGAQPSGIQE